jgi:uncharacterized protein (DUF169 family)
MSELSLSALLQLDSKPISISFVDAPPAGVPHVAAAEPASCGYWRRAAAGEVFYTTVDDHKHCPVGAHTHHVPLSPSEREQLMGLIDTMVNLSYITMEDVAQIPTRKTPLQTAVYAPLGRQPVPPDVVLVRGNARQLMLLAEAALQAGIAGVGPAMGRPTCAVLPAATNDGRTAASFGCVGNRVYTGASDADAYFAIPGPHLAVLEQKLATIVHANQQLEKFHHSRVQASIT